MAQWVLDALAASGRIDHVVLAGLGSSEGLVFERGLTVAGSPASAGSTSATGHDTSLAGNLFAAIDTVRELDPEARRVAFCWSDIPLVTGEMLRAFLDRVEEAGAEIDVCAGLVPRAILESRYPDVSESWLRLAEGEFVAADFGVFDVRRADRVRESLAALTEQRKSALRQARLIGIGLLVRYLLGRLTVPSLERALWRRYRIRARVLTVPDPELGLDVDTPINLEICRHALRDR